MHARRRHATTLVEGLLVVCLGLAAITFVTEAMRFFSTRAGKSTARDAQAREGTLFMDRLRRTLKLAVEVTPTERGLRIVHYARVDGVLRLVATTVEDHGDGRVVVAREDGSARRQYEVGALDEGLVASLGSGRVFSIRPVEGEAGEADRVHITLRVAGGELELVSQARSLVRGPGLVAHRAPRPPGEIEGELLGAVAPPPWPGLPPARVDPTGFEGPDGVDEATAVAGAEPTDGDLEEETEPAAVEPAGDEGGADPGELPEDEELPEPEDAAQAARQTEQVVGALAAALDARWRAALEQLERTNRARALKAAVEELDGFAGDPVARIAELEAKAAELEQEVAAARASQPLSREEIAALDEAGRTGDETAAEEFVAMHDANVVDGLTALMNRKRATARRLEFLRRLAAGEEGVAEDAAARYAEAEGNRAAAQGANAAAMTRALQLLDQASAQAQAWGELAPEEATPGEVLRRLGEIDARARPLLSDAKSRHRVSRQVAVDAASLANSLGG